MAVNWLREGFTTITPCLVVDGGEKAIEFYQKAFGAEVVDKSPGEDGKIMNAQLKIGNAMIMLNDEFPDWGQVGPNKMGGSPVSMHLYFPDANAAWDRAVKAGAEVTMELADQFWGDRYGTVKDPFGHKWAIAQRIAEPTQEEIDKAVAAMKG